MTDDRLDALGEFHDAVAPDGERPGRELLTRLARCYDEEVRDALLAILIELTEQDMPTARRCAGYLGRLARRLPPAEATALRTGTHLIIGEAAAHADLWAEAAWRTRKAQEHLAGGPFAEHAPASELVLAEAAVRTGRRDTAMAHWRKARGGLLAQGDWERAGYATAMLAWATCESGDLGMGTFELWREAADLAARAGLDADAREYATKGCSLAQARITGIADSDVREVLRMASEGRTLAERYRVTDAAPVLAGYLGVYGADAGWEWSVVSRWFATARAEFLAQGRPAERLGRALVGVDVAEGAAAVGRGLVVQAEPPLRAALLSARRLGMPEVESVCVRLLTGIRAVTEMTDISRIARLVARQRWSDAESEAVAQLVPAFDAQRSDAAGAHELIDRARAALERAGSDARYKVVILELAAAVMRPDPDREAVGRALRRAEDFVTDHAGSVPSTALRAVSTVIGVARAKLAAAADDPLTAAKATAEVEAQLLRAGAGVLAALMAVEQAQMLLRAGEAGQALEAVLPAVLALDAVRFTMDDADRRRRWSEVVARGFEVAFRAATACRQPTLVAELIEVARGNGVPAPRAGDADPLTDLLASLPTPDEASRPVAGRVLSGAVAAAGLDEAGTELGVPARVRTPWSTIALEAALAQATRYHDPVRSEAVVDWRVLESPGALLVTTAAPAGTAGSAAR